MLPSHAAAFRGTTAVMRNGRYIPDGRNIEARTGERPNGRLPPRSRTLYIHIYAPQTQAMRLFRSGCRRYLSRIRRVLATTFETHLSGTGPRNNISVLVRQCHDHVVERGLDVRLSIRLDDNVSFPHRTAGTPRFLLLFRHIILDLRGVETVRLLPRRLLLSGHGLATSLARTRICTGALSTYRKPPAMSKAPVTPNVHQSLDVHLYFRTQLPLDKVLVLNEAPHASGLLLRPVVRMHIVLDADTIKNFLSTRTPNPENRGQGNFSAFMRRYVHSGYSRHILSGFPAAPVRKRCIIHRRVSTLSLLVLRVFFVDDINAPFAPNDLIVGAALFDTGTNFHGFARSRS